MHLSKRSKLSVVFSVMCFIAVIGALMLTGALQRSPSAHAAGNVVVGQITTSGTTSITKTPTGKDGVNAPEVDQTVVGLGHDAVRHPSGGFVNRSYSQPSSKSTTTSSTAVSGSSSQLVRSFDGLNFRQQRLANNGNQFSVEPPDQGLCAGNGFVMESVNDVLNVYDTHGNSLLGVTDLNTFYNYPPAIIRSTAAFGPELTDPSCYFDQPTQRWFQIVLTLDRVGTKSTLAGTNHIDIAVSQTSSPLGKWMIYKLPVQDNGTQGTPDHGCSLGFCFGDYPHQGADANGYYITTNEYSFFGPEYHAAQIYAFPKQVIASGAQKVPVVRIDTVNTVNGVNPGFTLWPATSPGVNQYATALNGSEYFLSSDAALEANGSGASRDLIVWTLSNTAALNTNPGAILLSNNILTVNAYSIPPKATQKKGPTPLQKCLNTPTCATLINGQPDPYNEVPGVLDSNDTRMQQVTYTGGKLYGALDTNLTVNNINEAGIEWFVVNPVTPKVVNQGYLGANNANVLYPALGVTASGKGVMAFTLVGPNNYPSAAYVPFDAQNGPGSIQVAAAGLGPQDGFTEYKYYSPFGNGIPRPRWGDYGAAVPVGNSVWIASEYIGQTCTYQQYIKNTTTSPLFSCNMTRTALGNWYTRISLVNV